MGLACLSLICDHGGWEGWTLGKGAVPSLAQELAGHGDVSSRGFERNRSSKELRNATLGGTYQSWCIRQS